MLKRTAIVVLYAAGFIYLGICALLFFRQRSLIYFPTPASVPAGATAVALQSDGETLRILAGNAGARGAAIYFGGNAEDVSGSFEPVVDALPRQAVYLANYRGYGGSSGSPSEAGLLADGLALYDFVHRSHPEVCVIGRSLGSGVAVHVAAERKVERLVLVTPYDSIENVAKMRYPLFPVAWLLKDRFDSAARIPRVTASTLILLADHDRTIPRPRSEALIARFAPGQTSVSVIRGTEHNSIGSSPEYWRSIAGFCGR